jgi:phosphoribosylamine--glycine ligase
MSQKKILVVGGGGREHALAWKIASDSCRPRVFCAPGNAGTELVAENLPISATDLDGLTQWAQQERPDLVVIGPEAPLCAGLADRLQAAGLCVFGPTAAAAQLEGSKAFAKEIMRAAGVPTAHAERFTDAAAAREYARRRGAPIVIKADGLAAGKGVTVARSMAEAEAAIEAALVRREFAEAGRTVLIEDFLEGEEASVLALIDGRNMVLLPSAQDHKRVFDNDAGPNTGGMGAYSPAPIVEPQWLPAVREHVFERTLSELRRRGIVYRGVLYAGLMITSDGPRVLEFNCRFGDPETQAILPRLDGDILPALEACAGGGISDDLVRCKPEACVCVVLAAGGYPGSYRKGDEITGLEEAARLPGVLLFHAGTRRVNGRVATAGGRVLNVAAVGADLRTAASQCYQACSRIHFADMHYRRDIARRALRQNG